MSKNKRESLFPWPEPNLEIESYKTLFCADDTCKVHLNITYFDNTSACPFFRDKVLEKRRPLVINASNMFSYSEKYMFTTSENIGDCRNTYEYLYHPLNFRKKECLKQGGRCDDKYCPGYHDERQREAYSKFRKSISQIKSPTINQEFINILENLKGMASADEGMELRINLEENIKNFSGMEENTFFEKNPLLKKVRSFKTENNVNQYFRHQRVPIYEDKNTEFKCNKQYDMSMIAKYICGFLNSSGGTLYLGITDDGHVTGSYFDRKRRDEFQCVLDNILTRFNPPLLNDECELSFNTVYSDSSKLNLLEDTYIVEIHVLKQKNNELYFTHQQEAWKRMSGSMKKLTPIEIRNYTRDTFKKPLDKINDLATSELGLGGEEEKINFPPKVVKPVKEYPTYPAEKPKQQNYNKNDTSYPAIISNWDEFTTRTEGKKRNVLSNLLVPHVQTKILKEGKDEKSRKKAFLIAHMIIDDIKLIKEEVIAVFERVEELNERYLKLNVK